MKEVRAQRKTATVLQLSNLIPNKTFINLELCFSRCVLGAEFHYSEAISDKCENSRT